mmetsp:Transcript_24357/g.35772  ORF Transcript_24357/g.35772 Transcript_24357/m.35772 type:complete len:1526 (+) Transcript_24357:151-4728(+)
MSQGREEASRCDSIETFLSYLPSLRLRAADLNKSSWGIEALKVTKNGKLQPRRIALSPNNRTLLVTTTRIQNIRGLVKYAMPQKKDTGARCIDIGSICRIQKGEQTKRFDLARQRPSKMYRTSQLRPSDTDSMEDRFSLSIIYKAHASVSSCRESTTETLDLVVPSQEDFKALCVALDDLTRIYRECQSYIQPDILLIQHHLIHMGMDVDKHSLFLSDFLKICKRLNAGIPNSQATAIFKECSALIGADPDIGITIPQSLGLLEAVRRDALKNIGLEEDSDEPRFRIWNKILGGQSGNISFVSYDGGREECKEMSRESAIMSDNNARNTMSAVDFLSFLHFSQKQTDVSLEEVRTLFSSLNSQAEFVDGSGIESVGSVGGSREFITRETFARYLLSDANELFDPQKEEEMGFTYMDSPLSHYWINTSHDTYLANTGTNPVTPGEVGTFQTDLQMYTAALYRGCRCLDLDVWDGTNEEKEPVVRYGLSTSDAADKNDVKSPSKRVVGDSGSSLLFSDILRCVNSFLQSEPDSYPIILSIENHCMLQQQEKMASHLRSILGDVLYDFDECQLQDSFLASPENLRGKVIIKSKRPLHIKKGCVVVNDDFDDENDFYPDKHSSNALHEEENEFLEDIPTNVIGFNSLGYILSESSHVAGITPDELLSRAEKEFTDARKEASDVESQAFELQILANQAEERAKLMLENIGLTVQELEKKVGDYDDSQQNIPEVQFVESEDKVSSRVIRIVDNTDQGLEVQDFFADTVDRARSNYNAVSEEAALANKDAIHATSRLEEKSKALSDAERILENVTKRHADVKHSSVRALSMARSNREHANTDKERVRIVEDLLQKRREERSTAETVLVTAVTEAKISEQRALEAEERMASAQAVADEDRARADEETRREDRLENEAASQLRKLKELTQSTKAAKERMELTAALLEKIDRQILKLEHSIECNDGSKEVSSHNDNSAGSGRSLQKLHAKHKMKVDERTFYSQKLKAASEENVMAEMSRQKAQNTFDETARKVQQQAHIAALARRKADQTSRAVDQLAENAEEEREASDLRQNAAKRAEEGLHRSEGNYTSVKAQLVEAVRAANEAAELAQNSRHTAEKLAKDVMLLEDTKKYEEEIKIREEEKSTALKIYQEAMSKKAIIDAELADAQRLLDTSIEVLYKAEREAAAQVRRHNAERRSEQDTLEAHHHAVDTRRKAETALAEANTAVAKAADKAAAVSHAQLFREKTTRINVVSTELARITLLHSIKFRNLERSIALPSSYMHSISEGKLLQIAKSGKEDWNSWVQFNKTHLSRIFPSKYASRPSSNNHNPILPWAMGCQMVSMNFHAFDEHLFLNDGRFRENGSCGYVRKPDALIRCGVGSPQDEIALPRKWTIEVLSGYCLPRPERRAAKKVGVKRETISPRVRLSLYDGDLNAVSLPTVHETHAVQGNGLNPVWKENAGETFIVFSPAVAILLITVLDSASTESDDFVAAAAVPISCLREGYRRVSLFDASHTRNGAYRFASLLVKVNREY